LAGILDGLFNGISIGAVLLMAALGLAIVFGLMGVINMAHGELMMLGGYTTFVVQNSFKNLGESWFEVYVFAALPIAFLVTALVGLALERGVVRFLYGRPLETLLATWGVSLILQQFVRSVNWVLAIGLALFCLLFFGGLWFISRRADFPRIRGGVIAILLPLSAALTFLTGKILSGTYKLAVTKPWFGAQNVDVTAPKWLRGGLVLGSLQLPYARLFIIGLTLLCILGIYLFLQRSPWGLRIRAVTQNRTMSACLGIPTTKVDALTFALGSGLAGIAGCAVSFLGPVGPNTGQIYIVDTFMVVVVGGVGNLLGSIIAAMSIGAANYIIGSGVVLPILGSAASYVASSEILKPLLSEIIKSVTGFFEFFSTIPMAKVMVYALIFGFLQLRPAGIFPQKGRMADG